MVSVNSVCLHVHNAHCSQCIILIMWVWCYNTVYYCAGGAVVSVGSNIYSGVVVDSITSCSDFLSLYFCTLNTTDSYPCIDPNYYLVVECSRRELPFMCQYIMCMSSLNNHTVHVCMYMYEYRGRTREE